MLKALNFAKKEKNVNKERLLLVLFKLQAFSHILAL
jgi:hypothetical protein